MASRCVVLGPMRQVGPSTEDVRVRCLEVTPLDAAALCSGKESTWRVSFSLFDGELANATVLTARKEWVAEPDESSSRQRAEDVGWEVVGSLCHRSRPFDLPVPLTLAEFAGQ